VLDLKWIQWKHEEKAPVVPLVPHAPPA